MKIIIFLSVLLFIANAQANEPRPGVEGSRVAASNSYPWVGKLFRWNQFFCAAWILDPGTVLTAKHCFQHQGMDGDAAKKAVGDFRLYFWSSNTDLVTIETLEEIKFDSAENDIVIIHYAAEKTAQIILPKHDVFKDKVAADTKLTVVGFPGPQSHRVVSKDCRATGVQGRFGPHAQDSGYEGVFDDTTCGAWYGVSGGPVFHEKEDGSVTFYGLVTHTFDVLEDGSLNESLQKNDDFGPSMPAMFSALSLSADLP